MKKDEEKNSGSIKLDGRGHTELNGRKNEKKTMVILNTNRLRKHSGINAMKLKMNGLIYNTKRKRTTQSVTLNSCTRKSK